MLTRCIWSHCPLLPWYKRILDQLCPQLDIYHCIRVSIFGCHSCSLWAACCWGDWACMSSIPLWKPIVNGYQSQYTLQQLILHLHSRLMEIAPLNPSLLEIDHFPSSPIFSLRTPIPRQLADVCQRRGFVVRKIMPPTVPEGQERVRVCLHAGNTVDEIDGLVNTIRSWLGEATEVCRL